ncbi:hypothetical protein D9619_013670 [Psilocybe cf. subviscida]|uniref:Uncharacterized protein n=1 Tax=Psilocybe cf. subviscida TaxID=2480587 RepID=A0A8H5AZA3_9AGAR|nr:hypothetical protein D9619_013670 [Psilocybe cf. subviscida]
MALPMESSVIPPPHPSLYNYSANLRLRIMYSSQDFPTTKVHAADGTLLESHFAPNTNCLRIQEGTYILGSQPDDPPLVTVFSNAQNLVISGGFFGIEVSGEHRPAQNKCTQSYSENSDGPNTLLACQLVFQPLSDSLQKLSIEQEALNVELHLRTTPSPTAPPMPSARVSQSKIDTELNGIHTPSPMAPFFDEGSVTAQNGKHKSDIILHK